jgi:hypothetical protein
MASRQLKTKAERAKAERRERESQLHALLTKATPLTKKERAKVNRLAQRIPTLDSLTGSGAYAKNTHAWDDTSYKRAPGAGWTRQR